MKHRALLSRGPRVTAQVEYTHKVPRPQAQLGNWWEVAGGSD